MIKNLLIIAMAIVSISFVNGCRSYESTESVETDAQQPQLTTDEIKMSKSPVIIGGNIAKKYTEAIAIVVDILKPLPEAGLVKQQLTLVKEDFIKQMYVLGLQREALDAGVRSSVDRFVQNGISSIPLDLYETYQEISRHYMNSEIASLIADFNIITQYANFDLLKQQSPEEAKRLGIK